MQKEPNKALKKSKEECRRGMMAHNTPTVRRITACALVLSSAALTFLQLGFAGLGVSGEYAAYAIILLLPVALAAFLLGTRWGFLMGLFAGSVLYAHASLMPLDFYELTFVTPLTSIVMLAVAGLLLGLLFSFALRHDPPPLRSAIYIIIVCIIVSWLYSIGFMVNVMLAVIADTLVDVSSTVSQEEFEASLTSRVLTKVWRMGDVGIQAWVDAALMSASCIVGNAVLIKTKGYRGNVGLRELFGVRFFLVVFFSFLVISSVAFALLTQEEFSAAKESMSSELNYLWKQLNNAENRANGFADYIKTVSNDENVPNASIDKAEGAEKWASSFNILDGYSSSDDGTILIMFTTPNETGANKTGRNDTYYIALSDDDRFKEGTLLNDSVDEEVIGALTRSTKTHELERAVYDEGHEDPTKGHQDNLEITLGETVRSEIIYIFAETKEDCTIAIMYPASRVFANRANIMGWTALLAFVLLAAVLIVVYLLIERVIVSRIDDTNSVLARITAGDLNAEVDVRDTKEFASLSDGVNETVDALKGWIAEAESRMDAELATAKAIQESALPRVFPPFPDILKFDIYASMKAAKEVGGDFYDFFLIGDNCTHEQGKLGFVIADVSGKGVPAALFMMKAKTQIRDYLEANVELGEAVENANRQLCDGNDKGMFVTVWAGVLNYATGHIDYVNAGHNPPLVYQKGAGWSWLTEKSGLPLGLYEGLPYETFSIDCFTGDTLLLYTDGVTEAMNVDDELYGEDRLLELANKCLTLHPHMLIEATRDDVAAWAKGAEQSDDITMLALEIGVPPEITATLEVKADVSELPRVNEFIHDELDKRLCPQRIQSQLDIAVEELFVNVAHYAYPDTTPESPGTVIIQRTYTADPPSVSVCIIDSGIPYNPLEKPDAVTPDNIADVPIGGLGILMAKKSVDLIRYEYTDNKNVVTIVKKW